VVLHELATNASKYGALSDMEGQIRLTWSHVADGQLALRWTEFGGPGVTAPERRSLLQLAFGRVSLRDQASGVKAIEHRNWPSIRSIVNSAPGSLLL
jgi:two-component sensor histidine kinase